MEAIEKNLYTYLQEVGITDYKVFEHEAIFSTEDADKYGIIFPGLNLKNLLIKDKKKNRYYLVILEDHRHMDS